MKITRSTHPNGARLRYLYSDVDRDNTRIVKWEGHTCRLYDRAGNHRNSITEGDVVDGYERVSGSIDIAPRQKLLLL